VTGVSAVVVVVGGMVVGGLVVVVGGAVGGTVVVARVVGVRATVVDVVDVDGDFEEFECVTTRAITMAATAMMIATTMMVRLLTGAGFFPSGDSEDEPGCPGGGGGDPLSYVTVRTYPEQPGLARSSRSPAVAGAIPPGRSDVRAAGGLPAEGARRPPNGVSQSAGDCRSGLTSMRRSGRAMGVNPNFR
jgi:hypothetical protein